MTYSITEATPLEFYTSKLGKFGWPIIAHQNAMNSHFSSPVLALDGLFGPKTEQVAKEVQTASKVTADGVVGPETQEAFVRAKCKHAEKETTPPGLLIGINNIESSYQWACVSPLNDNGTHDIGTTQTSLFWPATSANLLAAFNPDYANHALAHELRGVWKVFATKVSTRRGWELAALNHNWPVAAEKLANDESAWLNKPFAFTTAKGYPTGLAYAEHYIDVATAQVTSWIVV